jgi:hypothetical protein
VKGGGEREGDKQTKRPQQKDARALRDRRHVARREDGQHATVAQSPCIFLQGTVGGRVPPIQAHHPPPVRSCGQHPRSFQGKLRRKTGLKTQKTIVGF